MAKFMVYLSVVAQMHLHYWTYPAVQAAVTENMKQGYVAGWQANSLLERGE